MTLFLWEESCRALGTIPCMVSTKIHRKLVHLHKGAENWTGFLNNDSFLVIVPHVLIVFSCVPSLCRSNVRDLGT